MGTLLSVRVGVRVRVYDRVTFRVKVVRVNVRVGNTG